jgi:hypothetical protein
VRSFGATGDGHTLDTAAIQRAIDAGGEVFFPAGRYLSGTLTLKSNVTLNLAPGAVLLGSRSMADYPVKHLLYASHVSNVAIAGSGAIDGQGDSFLDKDLKPLPRPSPLIEIWDSEGIRIQDITIRKAPAWTIHVKNCDGVKIRGISLLNNYNAINTDGIDIDSSRNVIVSDAHIEAGDDAIVLKTADRGGGAGPTENVVVTNCVLKSAASALKLGTESFGDFRHCIFSNCVIRDSRTGIALLAKDGGAMEDIRFQNIAIMTMPKWGQGVEWPIVLDIDKRSADSKLSHIRDVAFSDITLSTRGRILAEGSPDSIVENLSFRNLLMRVTGYEKIDRVKKMNGGSKGSGFGMPDYGPTPAALIFAYVRGLRLEGIDITWPDSARPGSPLASVSGDRLEDAAIGRISGGHAIDIQNSKEVRQ